MGDLDPGFRDRQTSVVCAECLREVSEAETQTQRWGYWSDGTGDLIPFCPECAEREFRGGYPGSSLKNMSGQ